MTDSTDWTPQSLIARSREIAEALTISQVGDQNAMAHVEMDQHLDALADDVQLLYGVLRVLSILASTLATVVAQDRTIGDDPVRLENETIEVIRKALREIKFGATEQ